MGKININSIKGRLIIGFISMAAVLLVVMILTLAQIGSIIGKGTSLLENLRPSKEYVLQLQSGVRHSNISLQTYLLKGDESYKEENKQIWKSEINPALDSLLLLKEDWENAEALLLFDQVYALTKQVEKDQQKVFDGARFNNSSASVYLMDYPEYSGDTIFSASALQSWINNELKTSAQGADNGSLYANTVEEDVDKIDHISSAILSELENSYLALRADIFDGRDRFVVIEIILILLALLLFFLLFKWVLNQVQFSISKIRGQMKILSVGDIPKEKVTLYDELGIVANELHQLSSNLENVKSFALEVGKGNFESDITVFNNEGEIGRSLAEMRTSLKQVSEDAVIRNWSNKGYAEFGNILRSHSSSLTDMSEEVINFMVKYLNANQGSLFILEEDDEGKTVLNLKATYAYDRQKFIEKTLEPGQGLAGQCYLEKESIYLKEIPTNYVTITSGLGKATPSTLFICPLVVNEEVYGVVELGSFNEFKEHEREFVETVGETIASSIQSVKVNQNTQHLLEESKELTEQMRAQEEEMRQNMEELQATQEEMERSQKENQIRLAAIEDSGIAYVEFNDKAEILSADKTFVELMGYESFSEIEGKHHSVFVDDEHAQSDEYKKLWEDLRAGKNVSGVFKRESRHGDTIFIKGAYSSFVKSNGEVERIMKFALDVTDLIAQQNGNAEQTEKLLSQIKLLKTEIEQKEKQPVTDSKIEDLRKEHKNLTKELKKQLEQTEKELQKALSNDK